MTAPLVFEMARTVPLPAPTRPRSGWLSAEVRKIYAQGATKPAGFMGSLWERVADKADTARAARNALALTDGEGQLLDDYDHFGTCYEVQPGTLGYGRCNRIRDGHTFHRSRAGGFWGRLSTESGAR